MYWRGYLDDRVPESVDQREVVDCPMDGGSYAIEIYVKETRTMKFIWHVGIVRRGKCKRMCFIVEGET